MFLLFPSYILIYRCECLGSFAYYCAYSLLYHFPISAIDLLSYLSKYYVNLMQPTKLIKGVHRILDFFITLGELL